MQTLSSEQAWQVSERSTLHPKENNRKTQVRTRPIEATGLGSLMQFVSWDGGEVERINNKRLIAVVLAKL